MVIAEDSSAAGQPCEAFRATSVDADAVEAQSEPVHRDEECRRHDEPAVIERGRGWAALIGAIRHARKGACFAGRTLAVFGRHPPTESDHGWCPALADLCFG